MVLVIYVLSGNTNGKAKTMWDYDVIESGVDENGVVMFTIMLIDAIIGMI